ncbi:MAG: DUF3391 domain-containing protein, partial [Zoogloeaceae bacterium]|nr:DUF3391 domain-containing protein [Zoogloeaceae bacterium]
MAEENVPLPTVSPDALRVGLYVFIDLPWFEHPFALNQFKIITPQQIEQLRKLPVTHFRYDPDKSEPEESAEGLPGEAAPGAGAPFGRAVARPVQYGLRPVDEAPRLRNLSAYQRHVLSVEENFEATLNVVDELGRHLLNKPALMLPKMAVLVESMVNEFLSLPDVTLRVMGEIGGGGRYAHELNVSILSMMLGQRLGLSAESIADLGQGAMLHDIGLSKVPSAVRLKMPAEMSAPERELYEQHCLYGLEIGQWLNLPQTTLDIIARHHEMMDGSGFPQGLNDPAT